MRENRLIHKIGGSPHAIRDMNKTLQERPESAAAAMASALQKDIVDIGRQHIKAGKIGRPTMYKPEMAVLVYDKLCDPKHCWTLKALAGLLGVYEQTFYEWVKAHDDLKFAIFQGKNIQEVHFGSMLLHGFKYSSGVEYILTNLHNWTLKQKTEHAVDLNAAIAAQERAKREQGIVWDDESAQAPAPKLLRQSPDEPAAPRQDDSDYKGGSGE